MIKTFINVALVNILDQYRILSKFDVDVEMRSSSWKMIKRRFGRPNWACEFFIPYDLSERDLCMHLYYNDWHIHCRVCLRDVINERYELS